MYGLQVHFKGNTTLKQVLTKPKDQDPKEKKSRVITSFQCNHIACNEEHIGETARTLGERCKEHLKQSSPTHAHVQQTGHSIYRHQLQHHRQGGSGAGQDHQGIQLHKGKQSNIKPKHW